MSRLRRWRLPAIWLLLALLLGGVWLQQRADRRQPAVAEREAGSGHAMFDFSEADLSRIEVLYDGHHAELLRDRAGRWLLHDDSHRHAGADHDDAHRRAATDRDGAHQPHRAGPTKAGTLAGQVALATRMRADQRLTPDRPLDAYGLTEPQAVVLFLGHGTADGDAPLLAELRVGDLLPTRFSYYVQRSGSPELWLVPRYHVALLLAAVFGEDHAPTPLPVEAERDG